MKTRILAIVPYNGMKEIMNEIADANDDMELTIHTANLEKGLEIVQSYDLDHFDIIAARGGTAKLIAEHVNIPVAQIEISVYDTLRAIKLARNYTNHFAIVGIPATTESAKVLCSLLQYDIQIVTLSEHTDDRDAMLELQKQGCEMVLCDMTTTFTAYELGMNYILITSGRESIEAALRQAISTARLYNYYRQQTKLLRSAFSGIKEALFVYDQEARLVFHSLPASKDTESIFHIIDEHMDSFLKDGSFHLEERTGGMLLSFRCRHAIIDGITYIYIYLNKQDAPALIEDLGISLYENIDKLDGESDFYGSASLVGDTRKALEPYSKTLQPILILGEVGTGKDKAASFLYSHSEYKKQPLFIIDCENTNLKKWNYFMESPNSPLNDIHITIYIKNLQALPETVSNKLLPYLKQNDLCRRNRFVFSYATSSDEDANQPICQYLMNTLSCMVLRLPPLRERSDDILNIATLYISQANIELGKQIVGFETGCLPLIQGFDWPHNLSQFKRIIRQLIALSDGDYISTESVRKMLKQETPRASGTIRPGYALVNTNQSLEDINYDIARMVLEEEDMNRSKAVERLKISRTTLWRMLQR